MTKNISFPKWRHPSSIGSVLPGFLKRQPHPALLLEDILEIIFNQPIHSARDIRRYALVCKLWSSVNSRALWANFAPTLAQLHDTHTRRVLIKNIHRLKNLCIDSISDWMHSGYQRPFRDYILELGPNLQLRSLKVRIYHKYNIGPEFLESFLEEFLTPAMRTLVLDFSSNQEWNWADLFHIVAQRTPFLENLDNGRVPARRPPDAPQFCSFFSSMLHLKSIKSISIHKSSEFVVLGKLSCLDTLWITYKGRRWFDDFRDTTQNIQSLFPRLTDFELTSHSRSELHVVHLLSSDTFHRLERLRMYSHDCGAHGHVSAIPPNRPYLKIISVYHITCEAYENPESLTDNDVTSPYSMMQCLKACGQLEDINIRPLYRIPRREIKPKDLREVFAALPRLRRASLPWGTHIGIQELRTMATCCPDLIELRLRDASLDYKEIIQSKDRIVMPKVKHMLAEWVRRSVRDGKRLQLPEPPTDSPQVSKRQRKKIFFRTFPGIKPLVRERKGVVHYGAWLRFFLNNGRND